MSNSVTETKLDTKITSRYNASERQNIHTSYSQTFTIRQPNFSTQWTYTLITARNDTAINDSPFSSISFFIDKIVKCLQHKACIISYNPIFFKRFEKLRCTQFKAWRFLVNIYCRGVFLPFCLLPVVRWCWDSLGLFLGMARGCTQVFGC